MEFQDTGTYMAYMYVKVKKTCTIFIFNRFVPPKNVFGTPQENPDNACFCNQASGSCNVPSGVFNVSICQYGSPVMLSWPHFFQADPKLIRDVEGLSPNKEKHQFHIELQPVSFFVQFFFFFFTKNLSILWCIFIVYFLEIG